ncbi:hypothetical protein ACHAXR_005982 [Thalassiosira sp. AJA248-18]
MAANLQNVPMTAEMQQLANDPNFVVQFAVGDPVPNLIPQSKDSGIKISGVYFKETKRYIMKSCHMSKDDIRILDVATGRVVMVSHHPGKNPYEALDPLGLGKTEDQHKVHGGEWEASVNVTSRERGMASFKIRPKTMSRHGRQYIKHVKGQGDNAIIMNIGKKSKLSTQSLRPHFEVGKGADGDDDYLIVADMMERTFTIKNNKDEVIAQVAKTTKAMIQTAVLGSGSESTIDIAPGVDCSTILAIVFGLGQVGAHFVKDVANNYVVDPIKDSLLGSAIDAVPGAGEAADAYTGVSNDLVQESKKLAKFQKFFKETFK